MWASGKCGASRPTLDCLLGGFQKRNTNPYIFKPVVLEEASCYTQVNLVLTNIRTITLVAAA